MISPFESPAEYDARHRVADMSDPLWLEAAACVPEGWSIVTEGVTQEGDIGYGALMHAWMLDHPYTSPKFSQVLDCGVGHFHAIARKPCPRCGGSGTVGLPTSTTEHFPRWVTCPMCHGR